MTGLGRLDTPATPELADRSDAAISRLAGPVGAQPLVLELIRL